MKRIFLIIVIAATFLTLNSYSQGHRIEIKINGISNVDILLGHHFADKKFVKDTITVDENGYGVFEGDTLYDGGIYLIVLPTMTFFEILMPEDQVFKIETDTSDFVGKMKITGSEQNQIFNDYQVFMIAQQKKMQSINEKIKEADKAEKEEDVEKYRDELRALDKKVKDYWRELAVKHKGTLFGTIMGGMAEPDIPKFEIPDFYTNKDSVRQMWQYIYSKDHFWDYIDFSDDRILKTPIYQNKLNQFFKKIVVQTPDSLIKETELFVEKTKKNRELFKYSLGHLLQEFSSSKIMGIDEVFVWLGETYYLSGQADWADSTLMSKIEERVKKISPNILGNIASDMRLVTMDNKIVQMHDIDSKYLILAFWEPNCGHCKKAIPKLHEAYTNMWDADKGVEVMAIFTQVQEHEEWREFITEHAFTDWINAYDPYGWSNFRNNYDIYSTPVVYILDRDKKIIAKRIDVEKVEEFIENYEKYKANK